MVDGKKLGGLLGLMAGWSALAPDDAEAAIRPDIEDIIAKAIGKQKWAGRFAGTLESPTAKAALKESAKYKGDTGYFTNHGLTWRNKHDGWTSDHIAEGYRGIYNSPDTVVIPNVLGVNPSAKEALWNPHGGESWYMPIVPYKKGFKSITLYNPEASKVEKLLKDKGYWEGGSTSSIFTPSLRERSKSIGSGTLSAVNNPSFENTIRGLDAWRKNKMLVTGGGACCLCSTLAEQKAWILPLKNRRSGTSSSEASARATCLKACAAGRGQGTCFDSSEGHCRRAGTGYSE